MEEALEFAEKIIGYAGREMYIYYLIYSQAKDYQNAFLYLKKANEIQVIIDKDGTVLF
ncbi:MAG TPA: hypothetical protein VN258_07875 [Mobilitalea sp.]|nr:hypothetical protein [Mobilitalea sp.]